MELLSTLWSLVPTAPVLWVAIGLSLLVLTLIQTGYIIMQRRSPVATLGWIIALTLLPVVGLVVYRIFGPMRVQRQRLRRMHGVAKLGSHKERLALVEEYPDAPRWALQHSRLIEKASGIPMSSASRVELLHNGVATMASMLQAVSDARDHVHLEYYIYEPDRIGTQLRDALVGKLREGVKVRLLVDGVGSPALCKRGGRKFLREFTELGGEFAIFHPARLARWRPLVNLRTHRKILICDGVVGFTGGINVTEDENEDVRADAYRDTHIRIEGPVVRWLQFVFLEDWVYARGERDRHVLAGELIVSSEPGTTAVQVVASGPDSHGEAIHRSLLDIIHTAERRVWLTTPYFVPTEGALYALTDAAMRGVDVKLLVPRKGDSRLVTAAARSYYDELIDAGIKVFEYQPRMLHAKTILVDDLYAQIGTANFDHRSFRLNFEVGVAVLDEKINAQLAAHFEHDLSASAIVRKGLKLPFTSRLEQAVARLFSPIL
jgi:cardiolipin synthase A/B